MRVYVFAGLVLGLTTLSGSSAVGQSLGDLARQQREAQSKAATSSTSKKIVTNEDLPEHPDEGQKAPQKSQVSDPPPPSNDLRSARLWKAVILQQKNTIASMQKDVDALRSSVHFVAANRYHNVEYNQVQMQKLQEVDQLQKQLNTEKKKLEQMQEAARRAGFGNAVYEP